jgi:hypothetical protein
MRGWEDVDAERLPAGWGWGVVEDGEMGRWGVP